MAPAAVEFRPPDRSRARIRREEVRGEQLAEGARRAQSVLRCRRAPPDRVAGRRGPRSRERASAPRARGLLDSLPPLVRGPAMRRVSGLIDDLNKYGCSRA